MSSWDFGGGSPSSGSDGWDDSPSPARTSPVSGPSDFGQEPAGPPAGGSDGTVASAPLLWVGLGLLSAVVALGIGLLTSSLTMGVVGWLLAGPVAIGLLAVFIHQDTARRSHPFYADSSAADWARRALVVTSLVAVGLNAWTIADVISRGGLG